MSRLPAQRLGVHLRTVSLPTQESVKAHAAGYLAADDADGLPRTAFAIAAMCAGAVPQQPPMIVAPADINAGIRDAM
jgi:hypothetical protein